MRVKVAKETTPRRGVSRDYIANSRARPMYAFTTHAPALPPPPFPFLADDPLDGEPGVLFRGFFDFYIFVNPRRASRGSPDGGGN